MGDATDDIIFWSHCVVPLYDVNIAEQESTSILLHPGKCGNDYAHEPVNNPEFREHATRYAVHCTPHTAQSSQKTGSLHSTNFKLILLMLVTGVQYF